MTCMNGKFPRTLDAKNRLIIPSKLRDDLGSKIVLAASFDNCIDDYSAEEWAIFTEKLDRLPDSKKEYRALKMYFHSNATDFELDSQGRITIPQEQMEMGNLGKEVIVIGLGKKAQIWNAETYRETHPSLEQQRDDVVKIAEDLDIDI